MADTERREDQKISKCLQEAFGYSDEQLLKQLDQANETLKDVTFDGAEERIMRKIMERKAELEKNSAAEASRDELQSGSDTCGKTEEGMNEPSNGIAAVKTEADDKKKIVRFGKKKVLATAALVAVIAGMLAGTAIGEKNYFFRKDNKLISTALVDNDKNKNNLTTLDNAYSEICRTLDMPVLKLEYCPAELVFEQYEIYKDEAQLIFDYKDNIINFLQIKKEKSTSLKYEFDVQQHKNIYNKWLDKEIEYSTNMDRDGNPEYESLIIINGNLYYISGSIPEEEFKKILEYLNLY